MTRLVDLAHLAGYWGFEVVADGKTVNNPSQIISLKIVHRFMRASPKPNK
jgi:hypothetical protein